CDPPVGGHSCNGGMIPRFYRAVRTKADRQVEKPTNDRSGSHPVKAQHEHKISASPPKPDICALMSRRRRDCHRIYMPRSAQLLTGGKWRREHTEACVETKMVTISRRVPQLRHTAYSPRGQRLLQAMLADGGTRPAC